MIGEKKCQTPHVMSDELFNIEQIRLRVISPINAKEPFYDATMGPFQKFELAILELEDESGFTGACEFPIDKIYLLENTFIPILLNAPKMNYSNLFEKLFWSIRNNGFRGDSALALGHLDRVFYDLAAKRENLPLYKYLGGTTNYVRAYASGGGINFSGNYLLEECLKYEEEGYETIKIKSGGLKTSVKEDVERISMVREALKQETKLAIDANQSMTLKKSLELVHELSFMDIAWLEEPIHSASLMEIEELCKNTSIKISYGESERSSKVFPSIIRSGVSHVQPIVGHISSFRDWLSIADYAKENKLDFSSGGNSFFNCQFVRAAGDFALLEFLQPVVGIFSEFFITKPSIENGNFIFPEIPGIGVLVDWERLKREKLIKFSKKWRC